MFYLDTVPCSLSHARNLKWAVATEARILEYQWLIYNTIKLKFTTSFEMIISSFSRLFIAYVINVILFTGLLLSNAPP